MVAERLKVEFLCRHEEVDEESRVGVRHQEHEEKTR